jgi:hypothetical protein
VDGNVNASVNVNVDTSVDVNVFQVLYESICDTMQSDLIFSE